MAADRGRLVLMTTDTVGGVWHYAVELASALGAYGTRVALATMGAPLTREQRAQIRRVPTATVHESAYRLEWMGESWPDVARAGAWLLRLERELEPSVVHLNQFAFGTLRFSAPKLVVAHSCVLSWWRAVRPGPLPREWARYRGVVRDGLAGADLVAAPTGAMLRTLRTNYGFQRAGVVIANGRSARDYLPARKEPLILAAGRLWDEGKNLAALEAVAPGLPWPIRVAGSATQPDGGTRIPRGVDAAGDLAPRALARELARASIYALPARYEPFGLSVLEAALSGCALVLGDIPTLREIWGPSAIYVAPDDHEALAAALKRLIEDASTRQSLAHAARARAIKLTPERMANAYLDAYEIMENRRVEPPLRVQPVPPGATACAS